jgi:hypothetical protein
MMRNLIESESDKSPLRTLSDREARVTSGTSRRYIAPQTPRIRSLAYFQPVVTVLQEHPTADGFLDYLRLKLSGLMEGRPGKNRRFQMTATVRPRRQEKARVGEQNRQREVRVSLVSSSRPAAFGGQCFDYHLPG